MIYLDNSATTYPKPPSVYQAVNNAMKMYGFNPGRGGYRRSILASQKVYETRGIVKRFFNAPAEENVIFTCGCTHALNMAIKGVLKRGDHVVISSMEHNAVLRPLRKLSSDGYITFSIAETAVGDDEKTIENFRKSINSRTRLLVCTHASNVFGFRLPVERLCALAHSYNILFCLDAAQSAGIFRIDMQSDGYDLVCCAGHKYLYGPMGTGILLVNNGVMLDTILEGGTGSESSDDNMPSYYPDRLEAGTANISGILGLGAGISFVSGRGIENIYGREMRLINKLRNELGGLDNITVYGDENSAPVLSFRVEDTDSEAVARYLSEHADIAVRSGLHCAPLAHRQMGTIDSGTVRIAPSVFTTEKDVQILFNSLRKMSHSA